MMTERFATRLGYTGPGLGSRTASFARQISEDMPNIVRMAHDSGDAEVVFHCPFCGSGQVLARNDGTIECEFCQACFTVQVQPQYPAFPQTINGVPIQVPGMGPQWDGMNEGVAPEQPMPGEEGDDEGGFPGDEDEEAPEEEDGGGDENPFAKKSFRTATGALLTEEQFLRHVAFATTHNRDALIQQLRQEKRSG